METFDVSSCVLTLLHSKRPKLYGVLAVLSAIGLCNIIISNVIRDSDKDSENFSLIRNSVSDGQKACISKGVTLVGI